MNLSLRICAALAIAAPLASAFAAEGSGLVPRHDDPWPRWQGRIALSSTSPLWNGELETHDPTSQASSTLSVMSDYYLSEPSAGLKSASGFRATGGVIVGSRAQAWAGPLPGAMTGATLSATRHVFGQSPNLLPGDVAGLDRRALPYVGVGYTGVSSRGSWSFSADLGVLSLSPSSAVKLGSALGGSQSLDDALRDMRWSPVLQLGVSYSF